MPGFDPLAFAELAVKRIKERVEGEALAAVSGGVDSTTAAVLAKRALGDRLHAVVIDTGFLREGEAQLVASSLRSLLDPEILDRSDRFFEAVRDLSDPEEKRKKFREVFYSVLSEEARERGVKWLIQGTIAPDVIETVGGIKTQHNVLEQAGVRSLERFGFRVLEPLVDLYKDQVRALARSLGIPKEISERQPFPGPGLLVRCLGRCGPEKLSTVRAVTSVVEEVFGGLGCSQYLAAAFEEGGFRRPDLERAAEVEEVRELSARATGVKGDQRRFGLMLAVSGIDYPDRAAEVRRSLIRAEPRAVRVLVEVERRSSGEFGVAARAVTTEDFMTASPCLPSMEILKEAAKLAFSSAPKCGTFYYDLTPKPPATIEFE